MHPMFRTAVNTSRIASMSRTRALHTTPVAYKTMTEKVSEVADTVNKKVGKGLASAIETGEHATQTAKETMGSASAETKQKTRETADKAEQKAGEVKQKTNETANMAQQKGNQMAAGARKASEDFKDEAKK